MDISNLAILLKRSKLDIEATSDIMFYIPEHPPLFHIYLLSVLDHMQLFIDIDIIQHNIFTIFLCPVFGTVNPGAVVIVSSGSGSEC